MHRILAFLLLMSFATAEAASDQNGHAQIVGDRIVLDGPVRFRSDSATLTRLSTEMLQDVAQLLNDNLEITRVEVAGHTDSEGSASYNLSLSQRRAEEVVRFLVANGVSAERLTAHGYGEAQPLSEGDSSWADRQNRRVEFIIVNR